MEYRRLEAAILRAALNPNSWSEVIAEFCALVPGTAAHFIGQDRTYKGSLPMLYQGYAPEVARPYAEHFQFVNPIREQWAHLEEGTVCSHRALIKDDDWVRSEMVNDWLLPQGLTGAVGAILAQDKSRVFVLASHTHGEASERAVHGAFAHLFPLLRHALDVNRLLLGLRLDEFVLRQGQQPGTSAIFVLNGSGAVTFANGPAEEMLALGEPVGLTPDGRLRAHDAALQFKLDTCLRYRHLHSSKVGGKIGTLLANVLPVDDTLVGDLGHGPFGFSLAPKAVLILSHPTPGVSDVEFIARRLCLTTAEAEVALALADGIVPEDIAADRNVSLHTIRNQIKSALAKVGVRRQIELVAQVERARRLKFMK